MLLECCTPGRRHAQLGRPTHSEPFEPIEPLGAERRRPGHADHAEDAHGQQRFARPGVRTALGISHDREPVDAQGVGDGGGVAGRRRHTPVRARGRAAVPGPVVGHPADAEFFRGGAEGLGGRADVERTVVSEDGEPAVPVFPACVVGVQRSAVVQLQIGLHHAQPPVSGRDRGDPHALSVRYRDADAPGVQVVYVIPHTLPSTTQTARLFRNSVATAMLRTVCERVCCATHNLLPSGLVRLAYSIRSSLIIQALTGRILGMNFRQWALQYHLCGTIFPAPLSTCVLSSKSLLKTLEAWLRVPKIEVHEQVRAK